MRNIAIDLQPGVDYETAGRAAREAALNAGSGRAAMVAWYDRARKMAGPSAVCSNEDWACASAYAEHHGAQIKVSVNHDDYEFFFSEVASSFQELDRKESLEIHRDTKGSEFDDVQGG
jgi:hypothetical protein